MVEKTPGGRTAAEIVERRRQIEEDHYKRWRSKIEKIAKQAQVEINILKDPPLPSIFDKYRKE